MADTPVDKWDDDGADGNVEGWRQIFVSLICRLRLKKGSLIIILLQPIAVQSTSLNRQSKQGTLPLRQLLLISPTVP